MPIKPKDYDFEYSQADLTRFMAKVEKAGPEILEGSPCWEYRVKYKGNRERGKVDYPLFWLSTTKRKSGMVLASRFAYVVAKGSISFEQPYIRHRCDNVLCVNPDHLEAGTHTDNMRDKVARGRSNSAIGSNNGNSVMTEEKVKAMKFLLENGWSKISMARIFDVDRGTVQQIAKGDTWGHV